MHNNLLAIITKPTTNDLLLHENTLSQKVGSFFRCQEEITPVMEVNHWRILI